ncbi:MAG: hypothetical protein ABIZ49_08750 [Opitutaceae bacterium]
MTIPSSGRQPAACPSPLQAAESAAIGQRRRHAGTDPEAPVVGFALSGGGIRSATFCLGLFQALARQRLIRRIDLLSTVSGGGYFGSFLGAAFSRDGASVDRVEAELSDNHSWPVNWLRENGRFLSPNGAGDNWITAAVALRNWVALQIVLLTFAFLMLGLGALIRADLATARFSREHWGALEKFFWDHYPTLGLWWSPWLVLTLVPFVFLLLPAGSLYWLTQVLPLMGAVRRICGLFGRRAREMSNAEFAARAQNVLTRTFTLGLVLAVSLLVFAVIDSLGQTIYLHWAETFAFPSLWTMLTGAGVGLFGFAAKIAVYAERLLGKRRLRIPFNVIALALALVWTLLIVIALSVLACGFAWQWELVWDTQSFLAMSGGWQLMVAVAICFAASWLFSRSFGFVNLSSMQQMYAARIARAYLGATNPARRAHANHSMTALIPGDDLPLDDYAPQRHGGPLHLINVTVNETLSGKTNIERADRKGLAMAVGPCGLSVGIESHALWAASPARRSPLARLQALWETQQRSIAPLACPTERGCFHALCDTGRATSDEPAAPQRIEALALGRWIAISGAAFTTGTGANTALGLSLLLGLANVRLGYWWDSGISAGSAAAPASRPTFAEVLSRLISRVLPVQTCLMTEFFARFHGPARRHWYLSDGGHFENTACYELIRRRVPFIVCTDGGQDPRYEFADLANLVRKARTDFGAEIQIVRRKDDLMKDDPGMQFPMPTLEDIVHPELLDVIGSPEDFNPLPSADAAESGAEPVRPVMARRHALLARIHYLDTNASCWLLMIKPSLMGDESMDVIQYQRTHPLFPQEPTSDQYFDEAQWESYRKLAEHIGTELFTPPTQAAKGWSPSLLAPPNLG